jgi:membrane protein insertase Oxa1/YidC/SpoIIIJ
MKKALVLCGIALTLDLVIIETIRFILNNGVSTVLFVPICLPLCFMILMFFSAKDTGKEKSREKTATFLIGVPILILAVYFEVYSFIQI